MKTTSNIKMTYVDDFKHDDGIRYEDDIKNMDNLKYEEGLGMLNMVPRKVGLFFRL